MQPHVILSASPLALSTTGLVTYLQGLFGPLFLGIVGYRGHLLPLHPRDHPVRAVPGPRGGDRRCFLHAQHRADARNRYRERARRPLISIIRRKERSRVGAAHLYQHLADRETALQAVRFPPAHATSRGPDRGIRGHYRAVRGDSQADRVAVQPYPAVALHPPARRAGLARHPAGARGQAAARARPFPGSVTWASRAPGAGWRRSRSRKRSWSSPVYGGRSGQR